VINLSLKEIKKRFFERGYDFTKEVEVTQCFEDMEWIINKVERYEKALIWYANERNYARSKEEYFEGYPPEIMNDKGYTARKTLEG
jgi:hypothetical protein